MLARSPAEAVTLARSFALSLSLSLACSLALCCYIETETRTHSSSKSGCVRFLGGMTQLLELLKSGGSVGIQCVCGMMMFITMMVCARACVYRSVYAMKIIHVSSRHVRAVARLIYCFFVPYLNHSSPARTFLCVWSLKGIRTSGANTSSTSPSGRSFSNA